MEIFGLEKSFALAYSKLTTKEGYVFLFESLPTLDLETVSYRQLLATCDASMVVSTGNSVDSKSISILKSVFFPKISTQVQPAQALSVRNKDNSLATSLGAHLVYSPSNIIYDHENLVGQNNDEVCMRWFEASAYKVVSDFNNTSQAVYHTALLPFEHVFGQPIKINCFVLKRASLVACKLEAFVEGAWQLISASFTPSNVNAGLIFETVITDRIRFTPLVLSNTGFNCAYFGLVDYEEADIIKKQFNFTHAIFCPSLKSGIENIRLNCTTSTLDGAGYNLSSAPCMLMEASTSYKSEIFLTVQDDAQDHLGISVVGGYVI